MAILQTIDSQQRYAADLNDKLSSLDVQRNLTSVFNATSVCTYMTTNAALAPFDPVDASTLDIPFASIPSRAVASAEPAVVSDSATPASPLSLRLAASSIHLKNFACAPSPCSSTSNQFTANVEVQFAPTDGHAALASLIFPAQLTSTGPAGAQTLNTCTINAGNGGGALPPVSVDRIIVHSPTKSCGGPRINCNTPSLPADAQCPAGYTLTGCGYILSWGIPVISNGDTNPSYEVHFNSPERMEMMAGNTCRVIAGWGVGCGVCHTAEATCLKLQ
jgi:hypothetical protein